MLVKAIRELSRGSPSSEVLEFLTGLSRPLRRTDDQKTVLYARNFYAWAHNMDCVNRWPGEEISYLAKDKGDKSVLKKTQAARVNGCLSS